MELAPRKNTAYADYTANTAFSKSFTAYTAYTYSCDIP